jgi:hypothetical protein
MQSKIAIVHADLFTQIANEHKSIIVSIMLEMCNRLGPSFPGFYRWSKSFAGLFYANKTWNRLFRVYVTDYYHVLGLRMVTHDEYMYHNLRGLKWYVRSYEARELIDRMLNGEIVLFDDRLDFAIADQ